MLFFAANPGRNPSVAVGAHGRSAFDRHLCDSHWTRLREDDRGSDRLSADQADRDRLPVRHCARLGAQLARDEVVAGAMPATHGTWNSGIVASLALAGLAASRGEMLTVVHHLWWRPIWSALLNVSAWMGLTTLSLLWLNAGEAATLAYTMPVWTALLAWPILGEQLVPRRLGALLLGICGIRVCWLGEMASISIWPNCRAW